MYTRCTTHFRSNGKTEAIVYRHNDGYPDGHGEDLEQFFDDVMSQTRDTRFHHPSYLAAKLVVWLANKFARTYKNKGQITFEDVILEDCGESAFVKANPLDFLSVGIVMDDPDDIAYRYIVDCDNYNEIPKVTCE